MKTEQEKRKTQTVPTQNPPSGESQGWHATRDYPTKQRQMLAKKDRTGPKTESWEQCRQCMMHRQGYNAVCQQNWSQHQLEECHGWCSCSWQQKQVALGKQQDGLRSVAAARFGLMQVWCWCAWGATGGKAIDKRGWVASGRLAWPQVQVVIPWPQEICLQTQRDNQTLWVQCGFCKKLVAPALSFFWGEGVVKSATTHTWSTLLCPTWWAYGQSLGHAKGLRVDRETGGCVAVETNMLQPDPPSGSASGFGQQPNKLGLPEGLQTFFWFCFLQYKLLSWCVRWLAIASKPSINLTCTAGRAQELPAIIAASARDACRKPLQTNRIVSAWSSWPPPIRWQGLLGQVELSNRN